MTLPEGSTGVVVPEPDGKSNGVEVRVKLHGRTEEFYVAKTDLALQD